MFSVMALSTFFFHFYIGMANIGDFSKESLLNQAQNVWSMLDEMAESSPEKYKEFIDKQMKEAKEYMKPPEPNMCVQSSLQVHEHQKFSYMKILIYESVVKFNRDLTKMPLNVKVIFEHKLFVLSFQKLPSFSINCHTHFPF